MKFIIKTVVNKLSWLWLTFSLFHLSLIHFTYDHMNRMKISEIHIEFSDLNEEALGGGGGGAFVFLKRLIFVLFSSCAVLSNI